MQLPASSITAKTCLLIVTVYGAAHASAPPHAGGKGSTNWYEQVIQISADEQPLDTGAFQPSAEGIWFELEAKGHAAPEWFDWDGDGLDDLIVGGFSGRFRVYRNVGTRSEPRFGAYNWIRADQEVAVVQNFCCVAARAQMADVDNDGDFELTAGSYAPGLIHWFDAVPEGLKSWRALTDYYGVQVLTALGNAADDPAQSFAAKPAWMDWDGDGDLDLIIGDLSGHLVVRRNRNEARRRRDGVTGVPNQPVFGKHTQGAAGQLNVFDYVDGGPGALTTEKYLNPDAADWDQDGRTDLVIGTQSGAVYWLRNIGEEGEPYFDAPEQLLPAVSESGHPPALLLEAGAQVGRGARASVEVADFNGDGKLDLLVGDWSRSVNIRSDLSEREREQLAAIGRSLAELDRRAGIEGPPFLFRNRLQSTTVYRDARRRDPQTWADVQALEQDAMSYLQIVREHTPESLFNYTHYHGHVWAYIRR